MNREQKERLMENLMSNITQIIDYMINDIELKDDEYLTVKDKNKAVLVATAEEFIVVDRDKFKQLDISENNRFLV